MRSRSRRSRDTNADIDVTAFMNLMVALVPFLLITAVFSQISILELNLPPAQNQAPNEEPNKPLVLELLIYKNRLELVDQQTGPIKIIANSQADNQSTPASSSTAVNNYNFVALKEALILVKNRFPDVTDITLLLEDDTPYDLLIKAMDTVRLHSEKKNGNTVQYELFPDIAIGSAPEDTAALPDTASSSPSDVNTSNIAVNLNNAIHVDQEAGTAP